MRVFAILLGCLEIAELGSLAQLPNITNHPTTRVVWAGANVSFAAAVSGTGPFTYQWQLDETNLPSNIISTVAGSAVGDFRTATNATLQSPYSVAIDSGNNLYIADSANYRIRKVDPNGVITTVVGNGVSGFGANNSVDGTAATNANIGMPWGVVVDDSGNLFYTEERRVRKVGSNGLLTTVAGNGDLGFSGDGFAATNANFNGPIGLALDKLGNLFIADSGNHRIRKVDTAGIITTVAGSSLPAGFSGDGGYATNASLNYPSGISVDRFGNLFIADTENSRIRKVSTNGIITTVAGNGGIGFSGDGVSATNTSLSWPEGVSVDASGTLFIPDRGVNRIRKVDQDGIITTIAGNGIQKFAGDGGPATNASLANPKQMALDSTGNLFIADEDNGRIRKLSTDGIITTVAGQTTGGLTGNNGPATDMSFWHSGAIAVGPSGELFIADRGHHRICKVGLNGKITVVVGNGMSGYVGDGGAATNARLYSPYAVISDAQGNLFISDWGNRRVRKVTTNGIINTVAGNGLSGYTGDGGQATNASIGSPWGLAIDSVGNLFISDYSNSRIRKMGTNGIIQTVAGGGSSPNDGIMATNAALYGPTGLAMDGAGNLIIATFNDNRLRKLAPNGIISTLAGNRIPGYAGDGGPATNANMRASWGVALEPSGSVFFADYGNHVIRKVLSTGVIATIAGTGLGNYSGDGGGALQATLCHPAGIAVDSFGDVFIAEDDNHLIRKVTNTQRQTLSLSNVKQSDSGNYRVVVTSPTGSSISRTAALIVATHPLIYSVTANADGSLKIDCVSPPNSTNVLECIIGITSPNSWLPISTNVADAHGNFQYTDLNTANSSARFYRFFGQ